MGTVEQVREPLGKRLIPVFGAAVVNGNGVDTDLLDILNAVSEPIVALERHGDPIRTLHAGSFKGLIQPQHLLRSTELFRHLAHSPPAIPMDGYTCAGTDPSILAYWR